MKPEPKNYRKKRLTDANLWVDFRTARELLCAELQQDGKDVLEAGRMADKQVDGRYADQGAMADGYIARSRWTKKPAEKKTRSPAKPKATAREEPEGLRISGDEQEHRQVLIDAAIESNTGRVNPRRDIEWVYLNIAIPWSAIDSESVPSSGAITLLTEAKMAPTWFLEKHYARLLSIKEDLGKAEAEEEAGNIHIDDLVAEAGILDAGELRAVGLGA